ncbi:MAG: YcgL domain-containing protein [Piscirickettsiaceae bacterium]|nr:YcgL domain-containing protein [Piscirickettsiaceae bacterium]
MNSYIYKSSKKEELYIYLAKKDDFSDVPQALYATMGKEPIFVMEVELSPEKKLAREDVVKVIENLETQGYHLQIPPPIASVVNFKEPAKYIK